MLSVCRLKKMKMVMIMMIKIAKKKLGQRIKELIQNQWMLLLEIADVLTGQMAYGGSSFGFELGFETEATRSLIDLKACFCKWETVYCFSEMSPKSARALKYEVQGSAPLDEDSIHVHSSIIVTQASSTTRPVILT